MGDEGADDDEEMEFLVLNKKDALVYQIPPASSSSGHKADDWKTCIWRGRCRIVGKGKDMSIKLIDPANGKLFAQCQIPGGDHNKYVERVTDSSRYFVLKITNGDRHAFIGLGFEDRNDAFDFNVALIDFKSTHVDKDSAANAPAKIQGLNKDLSIKEGQKITINIQGLVPRAKKREQQGNSAGGMGILAPPPPGGQSRRAPAVGGGYVAPAAASSPAPAAFGAFAAAPAPAAAAADDDFFADFGGFQSAGAGPAAAPANDFANFQAAPLIPASAPSPAVAAPTADFASAFAGIDFSAAAAPAPVSAFAGIDFSAAAAPAPVAAPKAAPAAAPAAAAPTPAPVVDLDPFTAAFGNAAAALPTAQPAAVPAAQKSSGKDPFDDFDIFK